MEGKLILLVEDNPDEEALTLRALSRNGINSEVVVARDGAEASAEIGQLARRQMLLRKNQEKMLQQRLAQRRHRLLSERAGEIEPMNFRPQRGVRGYDRKCHAHSSMTSAAALKRTGARAAGGLPSTQAG